MSRNISRPAPIKVKPVSAKDDTVAALQAARIATLEAELAEARMAIKVYKAQIARLKETATPLELKPSKPVSVDNGGLFFGSQSLSQSFKKPARREWGSCFKPTAPVEEKTIPLVEVPSVEPVKTEPTLNDDTDSEIPAPPSDSYWSSDESSNATPNDDSPQESD